MMTELPICNCCRAKRSSEGKLPRHKLPVIVAQGRDPIYLCDFCDGDALRSAKSAESKRLAGE